MPLPSSLSSLFLLDDAVLALARDDVPGSEISDRKLCIMEETLTPCTRGRSVGKQTAIIPTPSSSRPVKRGQRQQMRWRRI